MLQEFMNNTINFIGDNIFSVITAITAIVAIWQTHKQLKISNKQHLFDKRMEKFLICIGMLSLYSENKMLIKEENKDVALEVTMLFSGLTDNLYLKDIGNIINDTHNEKLRIDFLIKLEELYKVASEIELIFPSRHSKILKEFILEYRDLLQKLYKYRCVLEKIEKENDKKPQEFVKLQKIFAEEKYREELYDTYKKIDTIYKEIEAKNIIEKVKKQIEL
ncbi:MAG: hypothetical protein ACLR1U_02280 [Clostridia bacterium]